MFNKKDFIFHKRGAYLQEACTHAINFFEKRIDLQHPGFAGKKVNNKLKKSTDMFLDRNEYTLFEDILQGSLKDYKKIYFNHGISKFDLAPTFKIQRYNTGEGYFILHSEHGSSILRDGGDPSLRVLVWMVYLNDVHDGGYTEFPHQKRKFQPRRGDVLMWPAFFTHPHRGITSKSQTKYIATGWFSFTNR